MLYVQLYIGYLVGSIPKLDYVFHFIDFLKTILIKRVTLTLFLLTNKIYYVII